ncbi:lysophospholipase catalytic domain-containing protein [Lipomyces oligophaga]|uniref:lysophospholipase catalytic domain-containing protein n=1 Tax=Lipomyces oligophaga TaxID=45792 RepID=UPI0034CFDA5C
MVSSRSLLALVASFLLCYPATSALSQREPQQETLDVGHQAVLYSDHELSDLVDCVADFISVPSLSDSRDIAARSFLADSSYAPSSASCPEGSLIRFADGISEEEQTYITGRDNVSLPALIKFLDRINLKDFNTSTFFAAESASAIRIGIAVSGGGYRSMFSGAGFLAAADDRTVNATNSGHIGGLLQATSYVSGLSGGGWLLGSYVFSNFSSIQTLQADPHVWNVSGTLLDGTAVGYRSNEVYYNTIINEVSTKAEEGYSISITDPWATLLGHELFNTSSPTGPGIGVTWSDIQEISLFQNYSAPFPILVSVSASENVSSNINTTNVFELTPYEFGSYDTELAAFTNMKYIGTKVDNGIPEGNCTVGFDSGAFLIATSSNIFDAYPLNVPAFQSAVIPSVLLNDITEYKITNSTFLQNVANYYPNPFEGYDGSSEYSNKSILTLQDGGFDGQGVPLLPLLQPERGLDIVFALDNSADTSSNWPNGSSLVSTYQRQFFRKTNTVMPSVPDTSSFVNLGLIDRPVFFGCNSTDFADSDSIPPLLVYLANAPYTYMSNSSTLTLQFVTSQIAGLITNGYNMATQGNSSLYEDWPACIACAIIHREVERRGIAPTSQCQQCLNDFCWNGETEDRSESNSTDNRTYIIGNGVFIPETTSTLLSSSVSITSTLATSSARGNISVSQTAISTSRKSASSSAPESTTTSTSTTGAAATMQISTVAIVAAAGLFWVIC